MAMEGMAAGTGDFGAYGEAVVFLRYFRDLPDPRQRGKVLYPLGEVLLLCLLAVLAGAETFVDIARFGDKKRELLRRFRPFRDGTPSHDHLGDIFATLDAEPIKAKGFKDTKISRDETVDGDHGRIETRTTTVIHDVAWLQERHDWPGLKGVVVVESSREIGDKIEQETRFYITSLVLLAHLLGPIVRSHWAVENSLHWVMDMIFRDDECRIRTDHAPANFTTVKHMAHNLIRKAPGKDSLRLRRKVAAWDDDFLASLIAA
jgi:predicted transposase YbfD/YdcC